jgi:hypothetical protein
MRLPNNERNELLPNEREAGNKNATNATNYAMSRDQDRLDLPQNGRPKLMTVPYSGKKASRKVPTLEVGYPTLRKTTRISSHEADRIRAGTVRGNSYR